MSGKYRLKLLDHAKQSATDALQNAAQATSDLSGNKIANRIMKVSRTSPQNNSETITNEHDKEIPKKKTYISPEERGEITDDLRLI